MGSAWVGEAGGTSGETDPAQGRAPAESTLAEMDALWERAKREEASGPAGI